LNPIELPDGFVKDILGYCEPLSVRAGEGIAFKISSLTPGSAEAQFVRLISGDDRPHGTGLVAIPVESPVNGSFEATLQPLTPGSYAAFDGMPEVSRLGVALYVFPTLLRESHQAVFDFAGVRLEVNELGFRLVVEGSDVLELTMPMQVSRWHKIAIGQEFAVERLPIGPGEETVKRSVRIDAPVRAHAGIWRLSCEAPGMMHFNGRLEDVLIRDGEETICHWDFSREINSDRVIDVSGHHHDGVLRQTPTRAVKGVHWDGSSQCWHDKPEHYGAVHFHEDDLTDAAWSDSLNWDVPRALPSGQYALKLTQGESEDYIPFFVRPAADGPKAEVAYLVPTASYLAYANQRVGFGGGIFGSPTLRHANDAFLYMHEDVGYSLYEHHRDRSGVHFSSRHRPILNMKPRTGTWAFNADTHVTAWLEAIGEGYDVLTDEDLHNEGAAALEGYRVVITGTHPEYYSTPMLDGLTAWLGGGGRLMYMGGNGFYWRIAYHPSDSGLIEVRRAEDGTRAWEAPYGEYFHQFTGEYGGMWRRLGRPPNQTVGVGFAAQGFDGGTYYRVAPGALDPRVEFIVDGVEGEIWGDFGNQGGGAAGEELDRFDASLGSPRHAIVLATSENHKAGMLRVKEEFLMMRPLGNDKKVRADMVFFETPSGGAVFSTGSISYAGSLAHNDYANNIAQLTGNVLRRFKDPRPFHYPV
jgi:N,N-dimethylformamidase